MDGGLNPTMVFGREIGVTKRQVEESDAVVLEPYDEVSFF